jgi:glycerophosphoryl diester phosphodiesterase
VVWTVDEPDRITQLADWAVDGIITNRPGLARSVIDGHLDG